MNLTHKRRTARGDVVVHRPNPKTLVKRAERQLNIVVVVEYDERELQVGCEKFHEKAKMSTRRMLARIFPHHGVQQIPEIGRHVLEMVSHSTISMFGILAELLFDIQSPSDELPKIARKDLRPSIGFKNAPENVASAE
jgi:hypothetical protein